MCVLRELDEFEEAIENRQSSMIGEELADVALYLIMMLGDLETTGLLQLDRHHVEEADRHKASERLTKPIRRSMCNAFELWRKDREFIHHIRTAFEHVLALAWCLGINLQVECAIKLEKNADRPKLHGGKHPDT